MSRPAGWLLRDKPGSRSSSRRPPARYSRARLRIEALVDLSDAQLARGRPGRGREIPGSSERYPDGQSAALAASGFAAARSDGAAFGGPAGLAESAESAESPESPESAESPETPVVARPRRLARTRTPVARTPCASAAARSAPPPPASRPPRPLGPRWPRPFGAPVAAPVGAPVAAPVGAPVAAPAGAPVAAPVGSPARAPVGWPWCSSRLNRPRRRSLRCPPRDWSPAEPGWPALVGAGVRRIVAVCARRVVVRGSRARICHVGYLLIGDLSGGMPRPQLGARPGGRPPLIRGSLPCRSWREKGEAVTIGKSASLLTQSNSPKVIVAKSRVTTARCK